MSINAILKLFEGATQTPAIVLTVAAFVLGMVAMCLLCKIFCRPCGKGKCATPQKKTAAPRTAEMKFEKRHPAPADGSIEIYVGNLSYDMTDEQLLKEFEPFGKVNSARIVINRYNNKSKGFGFVHMPNRPEAEAAVAALNDKEILGRRIKCNEAKNVG